MHAINLGKIIKKDPEENIVSVLPLALLHYSKSTENQSAVRAQSEHELYMLFTIPCEST